MNRSIVDIDKYQNLQAVVKITDLFISVSVNEDYAAATHIMSALAQIQIYVQLDLPFSSTNAATSN